MEEVGYRTVTMSLDASQGILRDYIYWLLDKCTNDNVKPKDVIEDQAVEYLADHHLYQLQYPIRMFLALEVELVSCFLS